MRAVRLRLARRALYRALTALASLSRSAICAAVISCCEKLKQASQMLLALQQQGFEPTVITCNVLISAYEKGTGPERP